MQKPKTHNWNAGNAYLEYLGGNMNMPNPLVYQKVRILESLPNAEEDSLFIVFSSFNNRSIAIDFKWLVMYEFT